MPHNIGEMFYFGERPWHGLGRRLPTAATLSEALHYGSLNWEVALVPLATAESLADAVPQRMTVVRTDRRPGTPGRVLGAVHPDFRPLQNVEGARLFDSLLGRGDAVYHAGGYLGNGEVVWLLARMPGAITLAGQDVLEPYLLFSNSHDGSVGIDIRLTTVRVVCQNTLSLALHRGDGSQAFRRAHRFSPETLRIEAKAFFAFTQTRMQETEILFRRLAAARCDQTAFRAFLERLIRDPQRPAAADTNIRVRRAYATRRASLRAMRDAVHAVHVDGIAAREIPPAEPHWWGALNSVTAWVDHVQATQGDRYAHILLGSGDQLKSKALALATEAAQ